MKNVYVKYFDEIWKKMWKTDFIELYEEMDKIKKSSSIQ